MAQESVSSAATRKSATTVSEVSPTPAKDESAEARSQEASKLVDRYLVWSGAAGLIPFPLADVAAVGGVQLHMLKRLSEIYGVPFSENRGKSLIASLAGSVLPASTATTTAMGVSSALKFLPGVGTVVAVFTMPAFAAGATYVIGKVFIKHFESGGTLLDFDPPDYRDFIKTQKEKWASMRSRNSNNPPAS